MRRLFSRIRDHDTSLALGAVALVSTILCMVVAYEAWSGRDDALSLAKTRSANLVQVLDEQTRGAVRAVDLSLLGFVETLRLQPNTPAHDEIFTKRLQARVQELPFVRAIFVVGADGFIIQDSDLDTPRRNLADRDYFSVHRDQKEAGLFIGPPLMSRSPGAPWFLSMSRRISLIDGSFFGVAVAAIEPRYFAAFYERIAVGEEGSVTMLHRDGLVVARHPRHDHAVGLSLANSELLREHLPRTSNGTYRIKSVVDGIARVFSYREVQPFPLVVVVGLSERLALQAWKSNIIAAGLSLLAGLSVLTATAIAVIRRRRREALAAERREQTARAETVAEITSSLAHDFNNLLTVISGNLQLLQAQLVDDRSSRQLVKAMDAVERGSRLVGQLLAFSGRRILTGAVPANAGKVVLAIEDLLREASKPAALVVECAPQTWESRFEAGGLERAIMNLVLNARDAKAKSTVRVEVGNHPKMHFDSLAWPELTPRDYIFCRVKDDGEGMPRDVMRRAFERYYTTKTEGKGTGLGLPQVYGFARESGGSVKIDSEVGVGTTITILLPRTGVSDDKHPNQPLVDDLA
jgi:two-component system, NtrC family, sensor kinase